jgi:hypothetical protein
VKRFLLKLFVFFVLLGVIDFLFGNICQYMNDHSKGGGTKSRYYISKESNEDVLIFGSSRAKHHYVPEIFEDSLGVSCYNAGEDGNGIIYCYGVLKMITERYAPKMIVYDVYRFDIEKDDNMKYLDLLKPYYYSQGIDTIFWSIEPKTKIMMLSGLYRFNSSCVRIFGSYFHPMTNYPKGYEALHKVMNYEPNENDIRVKGVVDSVKIKYFKKFIQLTIANDIQLVCCVSPSYKPSKIEKEKYSEIIDLCEKYDIPFVYMENEERISDNRSLFQDRTHMNDEGSRLYTNGLIRLLKKYFN